MNGMDTELPPTTEEPSVIDLLRLLWRIKIPVAAGVLCGIALSVIHLATAPRIFEAEVVVVSASQTDVSGGLAGLASQLGGLGSMLGISLPSNGSGQEHLAILRSRSFSESFIQSESLLPILYPDKPSQWLNWLRGDSSKQPTLSDMAVYFDTEIRFVEEDRRTGLVTVRLQMADRELVAPLANKFVALANETIRQRTMRDTELALKYLRQQAEESPEIGVKQVIHRVMESQMQMAALARTRVDFAFRVIDPATEPSPSGYVSPHTGKVLALGVFAGLAGGLLMGLGVLASRGRLKASRTRH